MAGAGWAKNDMTTLISMRGERKVQQILTEAKRNETVFQTIADRMAELGRKRTWQQCRTKMKNLVN